MATSGITDVKVTSYDTLRFRWWIRSQSVENNESTIGWTMELIADANGLISSTAQKRWSVTINGQTFSDSNTIGIGNNATKTLATGVLVIPHNIDGTKSFSYTFSQQFDITFAGAAIETKGGSDKVTLDPIPRAATISTAFDFTDEQNPTITYDNPLGNGIELLQACISFTGGKDDIPYRDLPKHENSYTFELTDEERDILRAGVTNGNRTTVRFYVKSRFKGDTDSTFTYLTRNFVIAGAEPTLLPTVEDSNEATLALTGDNQKFVRYYSDLKYFFNDTPSKGATIESRKLTCGIQTQTEATGTLKGVNPNGSTAIFQVTDSRNITVETKLQLKMIEYRKPSCWIENIINSADSATILIKGNFFNESFGAVNNSLTLQYRYKTQDGQYGDWKTVSVVSISGQAYEANVTIGNLDFKNNYLVQAQVKDKLSTIQSEAYPMQLVPVFEWGAEDFTTNVPLHAANGIIFDVDQSNTYVDSVGNGIFFPDGEGGFTSLCEVIGNVSSDIYMNYNPERSSGGMSIYGTDIRLLGDEAVVLEASASGGGIYLEAAGDDFLPAASLQVADEVRINGQVVKDTVVDTLNGSNEWMYRLWGNGTIEAWGTANLTLNATSAYGNMYYSGTFSFTTTGDASQFKQVLNSHISVNKKNAVGFWQPVMASCTTSSGMVTISFFITNPVKVTDAVSLQCSIYLMGTWK